MSRKRIEGALRKKQHKNKPTKKPTKTPNSNKRTNKTQNNSTFQVLQRIQVLQSWPVKELLNSRHALHRKIGNSEQIAVTFQNHGEIFWYQRTTLNCLPPSHKKKKKTTVSEAIKKGIREFFYQQFKFSEHYWGSCTSTLSVWKKTCDNKESHFPLVADRRETKTLIYKAGNRNSAIIPFFLFIPIPVYPHLVIQSRGVLGLWQTLTAVQHHSHYIHLALTSVSVLLLSFLL